jgi:very-short-patch-repair endonuclease
MGSNIIPDEHRRFAKSQRRELTRAEKDLWRELRAGRFRAHKFRRQVPIGKYVADFICYDAKLIVELDGEPHQKVARREQDAERDRWLSAQSYRVLRISNEEMLGNPLNAMAKIAKALEAPSLGSAFG